MTESLFLSAFQGSESGMGWIRCGVHIRFSVEFLHTVFVSVVQNYAMDFMRCS